MARPAHMIYMKHKEHGNAHVADAEQAQREAAGWVRWPRTREQKLNRMAEISGVADRVPPEPVEAPVTVSRDSLMLDAACYGIKVDRRWSNQRLAAELAHAKSEKA